VSVTFVLYGGLCALHVAKWGQPKRQNHRSAPTDAEGGGGATWATGAAGTAGATCAGASTGAPASLPSPTDDFAPLGAAAARRLSARFLFLAWALVSPSALTRGLAGGAAAVGAATGAAGVLLPGAAARLPDGAAARDAVPPLLVPAATSPVVLPVGGGGKTALVLRTGFTTAWFDCMGRGATSNTRGVTGGSQQRGQLGVHTGCAPCASPAKG
jgi:hypothetical protein